MAPKNVHLAQATHNLACARHLLDGTPCLDWAVTSAFYSALHYVEAGFTATPIQHGDKSCPKGIGKHAYRQKKVLEVFGEECHNRYAKLRTASESARYLLTEHAEPSTAFAFLSIDDTGELIDGVDKIQELIKAVLPDKPA